MTNREKHARNLIWISDWIESLKHMKIVIGKMPEMCREASAFLLEEQKAIDKFFNRKNDDD